MRTSEIIEIIGKRLYGDKFSIQGKEIFVVYKRIYDNLVKEQKIGKKGFFVIGDVGVGKSAMVKTIQVLLKDTEMRFKWVNAYELKDLSELYNIAEIKAIYGRESNCDLYIDDVGFSFDVKRYGNTINIISELIMERYDLFVNSGIKTHFSTNLLISSEDQNIPTIEKLYGNRVLDRIKEMCELIPFNGQSLRK